MTEQVAAVQAAADGLAATPDDAAAAELAGAIDAFVTGPYAGFRALYLRLRERAIAVGDAASRLSTSMPIASMPPALVERLEAIDARMVEIDAAVAYLSQLGAGRAWRSPVWRPGISRASRAPPRRRWPT